MISQSASNSVKTRDKIAITDFEQKTQICNTMWLKKRTLTETKQKNINHTTAQQKKYCYN